MLSLATTLIKGKIPTLNSLREVKVPHGFAGSPSPLAQSNSYTKVAHPGKACSVPNAVLDTLSGADGERQRVTGVGLNRLTFTAVPRTCGKPLHSSHLSSSAPVCAHASLFSKPPLSKLCKSGKYRVQALETEEVVRGCSVLLHKNVVSSHLFSIVFYFYFFTLGSRREIKYFFLATTFLSLNNKQFFHFKQ